MIGTSILRLRTHTRIASLCAVAALVSGCVTYSPGKLASMSSVDLCELQQVQGMNMSAETKQALQSELQRRNDSCGTYAAVLAERRQAFMQRETYGKHDDP